jgi:hypothetical protein
MPPKPKIGHVSKVKVNAVKMIPTYIHTPTFQGPKIKIRPILEILGTSTLKPLMFSAAILNLPKW